MVEKRETTPKEGDGSFIAFHCNLGSRIIHLFSSWRGLPWHTVIQYLFIIMLFSLPAPKGALSDISQYQDL